MEKRHERQVYICEAHRRKIAICGLTVDDFFQTSTKDEEWIQEHIMMLHNAFDEVTFSHGDELGIIGMQVKMDRKHKAAILTQPKWEQKVNTEFKVTRKAPTPALADLMTED